MVHPNKKTLQTKIFQKLSLYCLTVLAVLMVAGCSGSKKLSKDSTYDPAASNQFFDHLYSIEMKSKLRITFMEDGNSYNANTEFRMAGDTVWAVGKMIGIELFRVKITADSGVELLNRVEKSYSSATWHEIQERFSNENLNFETFRNLFLGNPFIIRGAQYNFFNNKNRGVLEYDYSDRSLQLLIDILFQKRPKEIGWVLENDQISVEAYYSNFDSKTLENIPYFRNYITYLHNVQPVNIELEIKNISFNDQTKLPFEIPDRYTRVALLP